MWAAAYAISTFFAFPQPVPQTDNVLDFGVVLAPAAVASLLLLLDGLPRKRAVAWGFRASFVAHYLFFYWFFVVTVKYGHAPVVLGVLSPLVPSLYVSCFTALFAWGWHRMREVGVATPLAAAVLWTAIDHFRGFALGGFPWATLGYAEHLNTWLLPWVQFTGVYGLSFTVVIAGAGVADWVRRPRAGGRPPKSTLAAFGAVLAIHLSGVLLTMEDPGAAPVETIRVAALQGNIDQNEKWSEARVDSNLGTYLELSRRAITAGAQVVVWPESSVPGLVEFDDSLREPIGALAREHDVAFVLGSVAGTIDPATGQLSEFFDSAFVMNGKGNLVERYDKTHLVPFGEFVPFRTLIGSIFEALARGMATLDLTAGEQPRALSIARTSLLEGGVGTEDIRAGVPICYELLFPDLVRRMSGDGARMLLAITNDAWYGRTGAPYQFLAMTALRSAENGLYTVRAANSGVSAVIDSRGNVVQQSRIYVQDVVVGDIPLSPAGSAGTFYSRNGDLFAYACWLGVLVLFVAPVVNRRVGNG